MKIVQFLKRFVVMVVVCGLIAFASVNPAIAAQNAPDQITDNLTMPNIQKKAEDAVKGSTYDTNPEYTSDDSSNQGLNEIQGTSDFDKMKRSSNEDTPPVVKQAEKAFNKAGNNINSAKDSTLDKAGDAASYIKDKTGDALKSLTGKASDTAKAIKNKVKS
ncbi:hypothetical protein APA_2122 [Pseudanabaena sp. lw0831]|uniref:hypothetical protein n=1 Tax=Pseudanabaena sp. lw0831 TaxID=1357935 RepID=UPI0019162AFD|nr:hypothetical protein [Pseudanabaena sp. lw0831]GBO54174.1 hypothetical protein APA_2122 [Pseudanabaena sp. lw0831]